MPNSDKTAPQVFSAEFPRQRINPWRRFIGAMVPNWLLRHPEISQGAKLTYGRLAQYAGEHGECFPKQRTLAEQLGVGERMVRNYLCELIAFRLIESDQPGLKKSNRYHFLDHPWMLEDQSEVRPSSGQPRMESSGPDRRKSSGHDQQGTSVPYIKEIQVGGESMETTHTLGNTAIGFPKSLEEALAGAQQLGIKEEFARQEYHAKRAVGGKDGYGNPITSWTDHLLARWAIEQRKRAERPASGRKSGKRPTSPPPHFSSTDFNQSIEDF